VSQDRQSGTTRAGVKRGRSSSRNKKAGNTGRGRAKVTNRKNKGKLGGKKLNDGQAVAWQDQPEQDKVSIKGGRISWLRAGQGERKKKRTKIQKKKKTKNTTER